MICIKKFIPLLARKMLKKIYSKYLNIMSFVSRFLSVNSYDRFTKTIRVSIFGSCRQDSIFKNFSVTQIRDGLTYPHYTKEIIQSINYIKSRGQVSPKNLAVFRNVQIGKKVISVKSLHRQFKNTDLFVVEIASRISYEFGGDYFHHMIYDNKELGRSSKFGNLDVIKRIQSDDEIREDMQTIKKLLDPKPVIFITHFCSYNSGARSELRDLILSEAMKLKVRVFDPSRMLNNYSVGQLTINEPVINHFSKFAHEILAGRYQLLILEEYLLKNKAKSHIYIDQVIDSSPLRETNIGFHGFADCSYGSIFLYRHAVSRGRIPRINIENYFAKEYLDRENILSPVDFRKVHYIFHNQKIRNFSSLTHIFTNKRPKNEWDDRMRDYFLTNLFTLNSELKEEIKEIKSYLNLSSNYSSLHIRFGDAVCKYNGFRDFETESKLLLFLDELVKKYAPSNDLLILSDSDFFNKVLIDKGYKSRLGPVGNRGILGNIDRYQYFTLVDFLLLSESKFINHVSYNHRASGFSQLASVVSNIPFALDFKMSRILKAGLSLSS
jgi:hypothetical protein